MEVFFGREQESEIPTRCVAVDPARVRKFRTDDAALLVALLTSFTGSYLRGLRMNLVTVCHDRRHCSLVRTLHNTPPIFLMLPLNVQSSVSIESRTIS